MAKMVVDGMNVIGSRPDGWWRDRPGAVRRLTAALSELSVDEDDGITVVFDGQPPPGLPAGREGGVEVRFARRPGRDAADDRIVDLVAAEVEQVAVITADRALAARVEALGATVSGPGTLLRRLDQLAD